MKKKAKRAGSLALAFCIAWGQVPAMAAEPAQAGWLNVERVETQSGEKAILPPQMGWSSWNCFRQNIDENKIREVAQAVIDSGLNESGYVYLNMDDCWQSSMRDEEGRMQFDLTAFPSGPAFIKELNNMAGEGSEHPLKVGVYSSCGDYTCEDLVASYGHEELDARTFAEWGVEYLKYDYCHVVDMSVDTGYTRFTEAPEIDYITVAKANTPESEKYEAENAKLEGNASRQGWYVTGLNKGGGAVIFEKVKVPEAGRYVLTIGFRKTYSTGKYAQVVVNDEQTFDTTIAPTSGWSNTGRQQMYVDLKKGNNTIKIHNPIKGQREDSIRRYTKMGNALKAATAAVAEENNTEEKPIFYSVCEHGRTQPWTWAHDFASSWRISGDINANWSTIVSKYDAAVVLWDGQEPGAYNDPDMLEVGNGSLSEEENKSHFTLWCMLSAPLILGNDVRKFVKEDGSIDHEACNGAYDIVTNQELIKLNQEWPLLQCKRVSQEKNVDVLVKPLDHQEVAICFFNRGTSAATASYDLNKILTDDTRAELPKAGAYAVTDLWDEELHTELTAHTMSSGEIPAHGVRVYRVRAAQSGEAEKLVSFAAESSEQIVSAGETLTVEAVVENMGRTAMKDVKVGLELPDGFTAKKTSENTAASLKTGEKDVYTWQITSPSKAAAQGTEAALTASLSFHYEGEEESQIQSSVIDVRVFPEPADELTLGDMEWISAKGGWGSVRRNKSVDGNQITMQGKTYESGVGIHAAGDIKVYLGGKSYKFSATAGIDDEGMKSYEENPDYNPPQVSFELIADGVKIYDSGLVGVSNPTVDINVLVKDCRELILRVTEGGNGNSFDHTDWANAKFEALNPEIKHSITIEDTENGTITTNPANQAAEGEKVEISFLPEDGYQVKEAVVNGEAVELTDGKYVIENVIDDLVISAVFEMEGVTNIALEAKASTPAKTAGNSGPEKANDGDIEVTRNGFAINDGQDTDVRYLQYDWEKPQDMISLEFATSYGAMRGAEECDILISHDGQSFEKLTTWSGLKWQKAENVIETNKYKLTKEEREKAKNVKAMRVVLTKTKYAWGATVIMEFRVMGKETELPGNVVKIETTDGGSITALANGSPVQDGEKVEEGASLTLSFTAEKGYTLKSVRINGEKRELSEDGTIQIEKLTEDVTVDAEFVANTISGKIDFSQAGGSAEGVAVLLFDENGKQTAQTTADKNGNYVFSEIEYGTYVVKLEETYTYTGQEVSVVLSGESAQADVICPQKKETENPDLAEAVQAAEEASRIANQAAKDAENAKKLAKEAQAAAEKAETEAEEAARKAGADSAVAVQAQEAAVSAKNKSEAAQKLAENAKTAAEQSAKAAEDAASAAKEAQTGAEGSLQKAEEARDAAVQAQKEAEQFKNAVSALVESAKEYAEWAEAAKNLAVAAKDDALKAKAEAEQAVTNANDLKKEIETLLMQARFENSKVQIKAAKSPKKKQLKVTWKKTADAEGYEIRYATNTAFKKAKKAVVQEGTAQAKSIKKLKRGRKYFVKVRAYRTIGGQKVYTEYSNVKRVKIK